MSNFNCFAWAVAFQFFILYRSKCVRRVETVAILSLISLTQMEWEMLWGVVGGWGGLLLFQAAKWGSGLLYFDVALRFCHFKYFFNHKLTHAHTHTHVHRERGRVVRIQSLIHKLIHMAIPIFQANLLQLAASGLPTK